MGGIGDSLLVVAFCGSCTFLTSISLSAIATNGAMKVCYHYDNDWQSFLIMMMVMCEISPLSFFFLVLKVADICASISVASEM